MEETKDLYDARYGAHECPPYMVVYDTVHNMCKEQHNIVDEDVDLMVLSSVLGALPRLTKVTLSFCEAVEGRLARAILRLGHGHDRRVLRTPSPSRLEWYYLIIG